MPSVEENLRAAIQARTGGNCFPVRAKQNQSPPYSVYQRVGGEPITDLSDGKGALTRSRFQVDNWDVDYATAHATAELIADDLVASGAFKAIRVSAPIDFGFEEETSSYRVSQDFHVWHN